MKYVDVNAIHTGTVSFRIAEGYKVVAPSGDWLQIPGTALYEINRERNLKVITTQVNGVVEKIYSQFDGQFVEAGQKLMTIKHPLEQEEVIENILQELLFLFPAPKTAKYYFAMDLQAKIEKKKGHQAVSVMPGEDVFTMSLMRRDSTVYYKGESGLIYSIYFKPGKTVTEGEPLIGVCSPEKIALIEKAIYRVKADWHQER